MGECNYFMKAAFKDTPAALKARKYLNTFIKEAAKAYDFWQANRGKECDFWNTLNPSLISGALIIITAYQVSWTSVMKKFNNQVL